MEVFDHVARREALAADIDIELIAVPEEGADGPILPNSRSFGENAPRFLVEGSRAKPAGEGSGLRGKVRGVRNLDPVVLTVEEYRRALLA